MATVRHRPPQSIPTSRPSQTETAKSSKPAAQNRTPCHASNLLEKSGDPLHHPTKARADKGTRNKGTQKKGTQEKETRPAPVDRTPSPARKCQNRFREYVVKELGEPISLTPRLRRKLEADAARMRLSPQECQSVLASLVKRPQSEESAPAATAEPVPPPSSETVPPPPSNGDPGKTSSGSSPADSFRRWAEKKLNRYSAKVLTVDDERGLVAVGENKFKLSEVLAVHVIRDLATEREIRLERDLDIASCHSTVEASAQALTEDKKLKEFFDRVAPILTQQRGINAQSRVMMNAIAEQLGLTPDELEQAISALQRSPTAGEEDDPRQGERRESFRRYLRRTIAQLPNGIVTFKTERRLIEAGEHFHGVAPKWLKPTINEVASEVGARFVSEQQAGEHVAALVDDSLMDTASIDATKRSRIYTEGTRWGLDPMDVEAIINERLEWIRQRNATDRKRTRVVLFVAFSGLIVAGIFLLWIWVPWLSTESSAAPSDRLIVPEKPPHSMTRAEMAWRDEDLRIALVNVRLVFPKLRPMLENFDSTLASVRTEAYAQLIDGYTEDPSEDEDHQNQMRDLLAGLYALEPSDSAAREIQKSVLTNVTSLGDGLPKNAQDISVMFWECGTAATMLKRQGLSPERGTELTTALESAIHTVPDRYLDIKALQDECQRALSRRLYGALTVAAADDPERVGHMYEELADQAAACVDTAELNRLDVGLLSELLPVAGDDWDSYDEVIQRLALADEPNVVIRVLELYEDATDTVFRDYLAGIFLHRLKAPSGTLTEEEMIAALRKELGVSASSDRHRWDILEEEARVALRREESESKEPAASLQEIVNVAHLATLACALAHKEAGLATFDDLREEGPVALENDADPKTTTPSSAFIRPGRVSAGPMIEQYIGGLSVARAPDQRIRLLQMIATRVGTVPDISAESGHQLAEYLTGLKALEEEHRQMMTSVGELARWNAVRLGLADRLEEFSGRDAQLEELYSKVIGNEVNLRDKAGRIAAQKQLLAKVAATLAKEPEATDPKMHVFDVGSQALTDLYVAQARLLSVPLEPSFDGSQPSKIVAFMIPHMAEQLKSGTLSDSDRAFLERVPYELRAADFAAQNDLQFTVMLEQIWLRLLAIHVAEQRPDRAGAAREIAQRIELSGSGDQVFDQMLETQMIALELWMLFRPSSSRPEAKPKDV